jgi:hypothetical protein
MGILTLIRQSKGRIVLCLQREPLVAVVSFIVRWEWNMIDL